MQIIGKFKFILLNIVKFIKLLLIRRIMSKKWKSYPLICNDCGCKFIVNAPENGALDVKCPECESRNISIHEDMD